MINRNAQQIRNDIVKDMRTIVNILNEQEKILRTQKGVGCEFCADALVKAANRYRKNIKKLNKID